MPQCNKIWNFIYYILYKQKLYDWNCFNLSIYSTVILSLNNIIDGHFYKASQLLCMCVNACIALTLCILLPNRKLSIIKQRNIQIKNVYIHCSNFKLKTRVHIYCLIWKKNIEIKIDNICLLICFIIYK